MFSAYSVTKAKYIFIPAITACASSAMAGEQSVVWTEGVPAQLAVYKAPVARPVSRSVAATPSPSVPDAEPVKSEPAPQKATESALRIGSVSVTGADDLDPALLSAAIEGQIGEEANPERLAKLSAEIANIIREEQMPFARVFVPPQRVMMGMVEVRVEGGNIDDITVDGSDSKQIAAMLEPLRGKVAVRKEIERVILLIEDLPGVRVQKTRFLQANGRNILAVSISEQSHEVKLSADNYGSERYGPVRVRLQTDIYSLLTDNDVLSTSIRTNPVDPEELLYFSAAYAAPISRHGLLFGLSASVGNTAPGSDLDALNIAGDSIALSARASYPLRRGRKGSLWLDGQFNFRELTSAREQVRYRRDQVSSFELGLRGEIPVGKGRLRGGTSIARGLDIFSATRLGDPEASRADGDGVSTVGRFWADYWTPVVDNLSIYAAARGQIADRPLLSLDEMAIGGSYTVRGYDFAELTGDEGVYGLLEVRNNWRKPIDPIKWVQLYGFFDGGYVNDIDENSSEGSLFSAGPGVRTAIGPIDLEVEAAFPLNADRDASNSRDPHFNMRLGIDF